MDTSTKKVYEVIESELKLTKEQIDELFAKNNFLNKIIARDIVDVINFFEEFGITKEEMAKISMENEWFLTESFERVRYIQKFLQLVNITDIREMAVKHPISMSVNPITIKEFIDKKQSEGIPNEEIKKMILNDFENYFKI